MTSTSGRIHRLAVVKTEALFSEKLYQKNSTRLDVNVWRRLGQRLSTIYAILMSFLFNAHLCPIMAKKTRLPEGHRLRGWAEEGSNFKSAGNPTFRPPFCENICMGIDVAHYSWKILWIKRPKKSRHRLWNRLNMSLLTRCTSGIWTPNCEIDRTLTPCLVAEDLL